MKVHGIVDVPKPVKCLEGPKSPRNPSTKSLEMQLMAEVASHSKQQSKVNPRVLRTHHTLHDMYLIVYIRSSTVSDSVHNSTVSDSVHNSTVLVHSL